MSQRYIQRYKRKWKRDSLSPQMNKRLRTKFSKFVSQQWWNNAKDWDWHSFWFQGWVWLEHFSCVWVVVSKCRCCNGIEANGRQYDLDPFGIVILYPSCLLHSNSVFISISCSGNVGFFFLQKKRVVSHTWYICTIVCIYHTIKGVLITTWGCHIISLCLFF